MVFFFFMCKCLFAEHFSLVSPMRSVHRWLVCEQKCECKITTFFLSTNFFNAFLLRNVVFFVFLGFYFFKNVRFIIKKCCPTW